MKRQLSVISYQLLVLRLRRYVIGNFRQLITDNRQLTTLAKGQNGFALVIVILILLMVSFLAAELTLGVRSETIGGFNARQQVVGRSLAMAGINLGIFYLLDTPLVVDEEGVYLQGDIRDVWLEDGRVRYQLVSESGKIDINYVDRQLFYLLLEQYGLGEEDMDSIYDSLLDWRDSDDLHHLNGAENEYYEDLDEPYVARNGKIMDPNEFFLIKGTEGLAGRMKAADIFTVHNGKGKVAFNDLTPAMLIFLTNGDQEAQALYHKLRLEVGQLSAVHAQLILGDERYQELQPYLSFGRARSNFYTVMATGYAGELPPDEAEDGQDKTTPHVPGSRVSVLLEKRGAKITYYGWQEEWS